MITPSRWMTGGQGLSEYRNRMINDKSIKIIEDFAGYSDIFKNVKIEGGVSYFLWDKDYNGFCKYNGSLRNLNEYDIFVRDNISEQILFKTLQKHKVFCNNKVYSRKPFGVPSNFQEWSMNEKDIKCVSTGKKTNFINKDFVSDNHNILNMIKVCTPGAYGENVNNSVYNIKGTFILNKNEICTETYVVIGAFSKAEEAKNYLLYSNTKFYRFMLGIRKTGQCISKDNFSWVPDMVDYNHTYTDADLYKHFELTKKEIEHIEKSIKEIK
jgi:site-specific DNA-methyltransferase (adenine-specific)